MTTSERRRIVVVSAGDLDRERKKLSGVVRRFNSYAAENRKISLTQRHTDESPMGRLDVSDFDLVVFLVWTRWGPPSGRYSSEFSRAFTEAGRAGIPLLFYFRMIPDHDVVQPNRDISRIIRFRDEIEKSSHHSFFWYDDPEYWPDLFGDHLERWINGEMPHHQLAPDIAENKTRLAGLIRTLSKAKSKRPLEPFRMVLKAYSFAEKNRFTRACQYFAKALAAGREPYLLNEYGIFLKNCGLWLSAEKAFEDLARMGQFMKDKLVIGSAMRHLGDVNRRADKPARADRFLRRAAAAEKDSGRTLKAAAIQQERGMLHYKLGHLDKAQELFDQALKMYEEAESLEGQAIIYFSLTGVHIEKANKIAAVHTGQKALNLFRRIGAHDMIEKLQTLLMGLGEGRKS